MECISIITGKKAHAVRETAVSQNGLDYLVSVPHAGTMLPQKYAPRFNIGRSMRLSADLYTDIIGSTNRGIYICFNLARDFINVGRSRVPDTSDAKKHLRNGPFSPMPIVEGEQVLLDGYSRAELEDLAGIYDRFHDDLEWNLGKVRRKNGFALLLDLHSLSSIGPKNTPDEGIERSDFIIGNLHGRSAEKKVTESFCDALGDYTQHMGCSISMNRPYSGGYITQRYSDLEGRVNVIQLEINKRMYMDEKSFQPDLGRIAWLRGVLRSAMGDAAASCRKVYR